MSRSAIDLKPQKFLQNQLIEQYYQSKPAETSPKPRNLAVSSSKNHRIVQYYLSKTAETSPKPTNQAVYRFKTAETSPKSKNRAVSI